MDRCQVAARVLILGLLQEIALGANPQVEPNPEAQALNAEAIARLPSPGTVVPGAIEFTPDGKAITYLRSESTSLSRVLWRADLTGEAPRVVARPPGEGDTEANVSQAEALRRERQRLRETGITQVVRAENDASIIIPLGGDLYLLQGEGPLRRITQTPSPEIDPKLSRDGTKVAFVRDDELHRIDLESMKEVQLSRGSGEGITHATAEFIAQEELDRSSGFWWSPDGERLAYQETDERHIPLYSIVHQGGEEISVETHRYPFAGAANARVRLGVVGVEGGPTRWLTLADPEEDHYLARVNWETPGTLLVQLLTRDQKVLRLLRVDVESGETTTLLEERSEFWVNLHDDLRVVEATGEWLWSSERSGFRHLELHDRDGKLVRVLTSGDWPVDGVIVLDQRRREAWFTAGRETPLQSQLYRISLDGGEPVRVSDGTGTHRAVVAADGEHYVDIVSTRECLPITTLRDRSGERIATIDDARDDPRLETLKLAPPLLAEFQNRDGATLHGAYYPPRSGALGERAPLVVMVYGGPHVQIVTESWSMTADLMAQYLAELGFAVWKMDNRGSSRRGLAFEAALNRDMGRVEVRDQVDGVAFVARRWPEVDVNRVGVTGGSYGGYLTLRCLTEAPDVFKAGVAVAPVTDWDGYDTGYTERYMGTPASNPDGYHRSAVLPHISKLRGELLLIHGMLDENVHFRHTARLVTALVTASKPFELLPLPDERHSSRRAPDRKYVAERSSGFFLKALAPRP